VESQAPDACAAPATHDELARVCAPSDAQAGRTFEPLSAVARPAITPWFHVEPRRPLALKSPSPRVQAPRRQLADRASARPPNSTPQQLGRPHRGYPVAACLEAAFLRPTMAQPESLKGCETWTHGSWPLTSTGIGGRRPYLGSEPRLRIGPGQPATPLMSRT